MKKVFLLAAMSAMILGFASCDKNNTTTDKPGKEEENPDTPPTPPAAEYRLFEDFEDGGTLTWSPKKNTACTVEIVANPSKDDVNGSDNVGKFTAEGKAKWEFAYSSWFGVVNGDETPEFIDFTKDGYVLKIDMYVDRQDVPIYVKIEGDGGAKKEVQGVTTTKVSQWETLSFDFEPLTPEDGVYRNLVINFNAGIIPEAGQVFYFDNVRLCKE